MQLLRRFAPVLAVGLVAAGLVVLDPNAPSAAAFSASDWYQNMRSRVYALRVPGSTITAAMPGGGSSDTSTSIRRVAGARSNAAAGQRGVTLVPADSVTRYTGPLKKFGASTLRGVGNAALAGTVLSFTYDQFAGNGVLGSGFGFSGLTGYDSAGLMCDLTRVVDADTDCGLVPAEGYALNSDITGVVPAGWPGGNSAQWAITPTTPYEGTPSGYVEISVTSNSGYRQLITSQAPSSVTVTMRFEGTCQARTSNINTIAAATVQASLLQQNADGSKTASFGQSATTGGTQGWSWDKQCGRLVQDATQTVTFQSTNTSSGSTLYGYVDHWTFTVMPGISMIGNQSQAIRYLQFYPQGHASWTPGQEGDPVRAWETTWRCSDGSTGSATSDPWRESDPEWPMPPDPVCVSGSLVYVLVQQTSDGIDPTTLYEWELPAELAAFGEQYPECTKGACMLELHRVDVATGTRVACFDQPDACLGWFEDPAKSTNYQCTYGSHGVDLRECYVYAPTFDRAAGTEEGTYADPETGVTPTSPSPSPAPQPTAGCGDAPPFEMSLGGIGYWIGHGTLWALCEAFRPSPGGIDTAQVSEALDGSVLGAVGGASDTITAAFGSLGSRQCGVIVQTSPTVFAGNGVTVDTCAWPWSGMGAIRLVVGTGFILGAVIIGVKAVLRTIRVEVDQAPTGSGT